MKIKGNRLIYKLSQVLIKLGSRMADRNRDKVVVKHEYSFVNPFTLLINFHLDDGSKYQIILQGNYIEKFKQDRENAFELDDEAVLAIIKKHKWFKKYE